MVDQIAGAVDLHALAAGGLLGALRAVPDPRARRGIRHQVTAILALAVCAVLAGSRSFSAIGQWAANASQGVLHSMGCGPAAPCESTIRRVLQAVDGDELDNAIGGWAAATTDYPAGVRRAIAADGKTVRGSGGHGMDRRHLMAAIDHDHGVVLGQVDVHAKTNEIPMFSQLMDRIADLEDMVVTADAMHAQKAHADYLVLQRRAHYVLTVKRNQCATRRSDVYPPQAGGTRREVPGSDDSPGAERRRGQQHVRKPSVGPGVPGTARWEDPHGMAKAGLLEPQSPAAAIYCGRGLPRHL